MMTQGSQDLHSAEEPLSVAYADLLALPLAPSVQRALYAALLTLLESRPGSGQAPNLEGQLRHGILVADLQRCGEEARAGHWREAFDRLEALRLPCRRQGERDRLNSLQLELVHQFWRERLPIDQLSGPARSTEADQLWALQAVLSDLEGLGPEATPAWLGAADRQLTLRSLALHLNLDQGLDELAAWRLEQRLLGLMDRLCDGGESTPTWVQVNADIRLRQGIARLVASGHPVESAQLLRVQRWVQLSQRLRATDSSRVDNSEPMSFALLRHWK